jgi:ATP-dependent exoDNAse (exonuclease V) alpha subunit
MTQSFAMTINKSQGQPLKNVGLYLPKQVFCYGQLYVCVVKGYRQEWTESANL